MAHLAVLAGEQQTIDSDGFLKNLKAIVTCVACKFVMAEPISTPSGHSFCKCCFEELARGAPDCPSLKPFVREVAFRHSISTSTAKLQKWLIATEMNASWVLLGEKYMWMWSVTMRLGLQAPSTSTYSKVDRHSPTARSSLASTPLEKEAFSFFVTFEVATTVHP